MYLPLKLSYWIERFTGCWTNLHSPNLLLYDGVIYSIINDSFSPIFLSMF
jgi:hypothetical protein